MTRIYRALSPSDRAYGADRFGEPSIWRGAADRAL